MRKTHPISLDQLDLYVANIKACYYQALQYPSIADCGLSWYIEANSKAQRIAARHKVSLSLVCGAIAALSPGNKWERNLVDADLLIKAHNLGNKLDSFKSATYGHNKEKAWQIAKGFDPLDVLRGNKVRAFYECLLDPCNSYAVCVDSHATNIALGKQATIAQTPTLTDQRYELMASAYRKATQEINADSLESPILPLQVQAATWTLYRVLRGIDTSFTI